MDHFSQPIEKFTKRVKSARSVYILCVFCQLAMTAYNILSVGVLLARESLDTKSLLGLIERRWWRKTQTSQGKWGEKRRMMMLLARLLMMWVWAVGRPELLSFFFSCTPFLMINFTKHFCSLKKNPSFITHPAYNKVRGAAGLCDSDRGNTAPLSVGRAQLAALLLGSGHWYHPGRRDGPGQDYPNHCLSLLTL